MKTAKAKFDVASEEILIEGGGRLWIGEDGNFIGARGAVARASLSSVRAAVQRAHRYLGTGEEAQVELFDADEDALEEDEEAFSPPSVVLEVLPDRVHVSCTVAVERGTRFERFETTAPLIPVLKRRRLSVVEFWSDDQTNATVATITCEIRGRGRTLGDGMEAGEELAALWEATLGGALTFQTAMDLIRAASPELLVGQVESEWLEAKRESYRLAEIDQQFEFAKDVAAMANTAAGGLIIVGLATAKRNGYDEITKVRPVPLELIQPADHHKIIKRLVYPPPEALSIELVLTSPNKGILVIAIPNSRLKSVRC